VEERLKDAAKRGKWMHSLTMATPYEDVTKRTPSFDPNAESLHGVTKWLYTTPRTTEAANSTPVIIENSQFPYSQPAFEFFEDDLAVGAEWQTMKAESLYKQLPVQVISPAFYIDAPGTGRRLWADAGTMAQARRTKMMARRLEVNAS